MQLLIYGLFLFLLVLDVLPQLFDPNLKNLFLNVGSIEQLL